MLLLNRNTESILILIVLILIGCPGKQMNNIRSIAFFVVVSHYTSCFQKLIFFFFRIVGCLGVSAQGCEFSALPLA